MIYRPHRRCTGKFPGLIRDKSTLKQTMSLTFWSCFDIRLVCYLVLIDNIISTKKNFTKKFVYVYHTKTGL